MKLLFYFSKGESFNIVIYFIENHASIPHSPMYHRRTQVFSKQLFSATAFLSTCQKSKTKKYISPQQSSSRSEERRVGKRVDHGGRRNMRKKKKTATNT